VVVRTNEAFRSQGQGADLAQVAAHVQTTWLELATGTLAPDSISAVQKIARATSKSLRGE
jgi:hypothetical protein